MGLGRIKQGRGAGEPKQLGALARRSIRDVGARQSVNVLQLEKYEVEALGSLIRRLSFSSYC